MAKALFLGLPLHGHTKPLLPLVRALVERGDEVVYFSGDAFADGILKTGARYRGYQVPFLANLRQLSERTDEMAWLLTRTTGEVLARHLDAFRVESADYIISDSVAPGAVGRSDPQPAGGDVGDDLRPQSARARIRCFPWNQAAERPARLVEDPARREGGHARSPPPAPVRRTRTGIMGLMFGSSSEHRLSVSPLPAVRGEFRRSLPVHRTVGRSSERARECSVGRNRRD